jgi:hypothetical protein
MAPHSPDTPDSFDAEFEVKKAELLGRSSDDIEHRHISPEMLRVATALEVNGFSVRSASTGSTEPSHLTSVMLDLDEPMPRYVEELSVATEFRERGIPDDLRKVLEEEEIPEKNLYFEAVRRTSSASGETEEYQQWVAETERFAETVRAFNDSINETPRLFVLARDWLWAGERDHVDALRKHLVVSLQHQSHGLFGEDGPPPAEPGPRPPLSEKELQKSRKTMEAFADFLIAHARTAHG